MMGIKSLICRVFFLNMAIMSLAAIESDYFDQKDEDFWVLRDKKSFVEAADKLIDEQGNWQGQPPVPQYIKYVQELTEKDLPILEKWLSLKELKCFAIADETYEPNLRLIHSWYSDLEEQGENLAERNLYKLAWINFDTMLEEVNRIKYGPQPILPPEWVETNRDFQMKNSHYIPIGAH